MQPFMQHTLYGTVIQFIAVIDCESLWSTWSKRKYPGVSLPNLMIILSAGFSRLTKELVKG